MVINVYAVRIAGKLYLDSEFYSFYPSTTKDIAHAHLFTDYARAQRLAKKARGEVLELMLSDGIYDEEVERLTKERDMALKEAEIAKAAVLKVVNHQGKD